MIISYTTYSECKIDEDNIVDYFVKCTVKDKVSAKDILEEAGYDGSRYHPKFTRFYYDDEAEEVYDKNELNALVDRINKALAERSGK